MYPLEAAFIAIALGSLIGVTVRGMERRYLLALLAAGLASIVLAGVIGQLRWQMVPAGLLFVLLSLLSFKRSSWHVAIRLVGVSLGALLLAVSVALSVGLPILTLPAPDGPYAVGSMSFAALDQSRDNSFFGVPGEKRELYVQIWYPGVIEQGKSEPRVRTLWQELYRGGRGLVAQLTGYLRGVKTHSYEDIPVSSAQASYPVIVFSHAMVSFAEQNTLLMEHLASHGYVVIGISHTYTSMRAVLSRGRVIDPNLDKVNEASAEFRAVANELAPRIEASASREERASLHLESYERAGALNAVAGIWVDDLRFALDFVTAPPGRDAKLDEFSKHIDIDRTGLLGMSFGGGVVTEFCKIDSRCRAAVNIDGATYGRHQREPLRVPYLALIRENQSTLDFLLPASENDYYQVRVAGAQHLDFTDDAVVLPILKWLKMSGRIPGDRIIEITNAVSLRFFDAYLLGRPKPRFDGEFPELTVEMNDYARGSRP